MHGEDKVVFALAAEVLRPALGAPADPGGGWEAVRGESEGVRARVREVDRHGAAVEAAGPEQR